MTADTLGGVWTYALELAEALHPHGVEVILAAMGGPPDEAQQAAVEKVPNVELFVGRYKLEWMNEPWEDVKAAGEWLLDLETLTRPDLIHLNGFAHGDLPWQAPVLMVAHSCVFSWFSAVKGSLPPPSWARYRNQVSKGLRGADLVTAPTRAMLSCLETYYGPFLSAGHIYNGRSPSKFSPGLKEPYVLTAGRVWDEAKNAAALDRVTPILPWPVFVAGEHRHPEGGQRMLQGLVGLGRLTPDELAGWFSRASVFALPARYEPFGLCALEAALAGCALVLGDIPSLREVWGESALYVPPDQPSALGRTLLSLAEDPLLRLKYSERARSRGLRYTPEAMAASYMKVYGTLLGGRKNRFIGRPPEGTEAVEADEGPGPRAIRKKEQGHS
jgi:glycogen synthase